VRARTARAEETVREKAALLEAAHGKEVEVGQRASALWSELMVTSSFASLVRSASTPARCSWSSTSSASKSGFSRGWMPCAYASTSIASQTLRSCFFSLRQDFFSSSILSYPIECFMWAVWA
jgi:hypothetical protein